MSRSLVVGGRSAPGRRPPAGGGGDGDAAGDLALVESGRDALGPLGRDVAPLRARLGRLEARLADPALAGHPRRPAAVARAASLRAGLEPLERAADEVMTGMAEAWERLPRSMRPEPRASDGLTWAMRVWRDALEGPAERVPDRLGEVPW